ncbi:MAG: Bacterial lipid biosynthesis acyltransferase, partial [Deltaproteobacteria bacterium]|nr:Bacterial lipid biosynthesis acyltransferase [Deltaproteobacteria bacterium]
PARFAHRAGVAVTTGFATREGGRIRIEIQPPIDYSSAGSPEEAEKIILDEYSRRLEETVRKCPEQYFWFHKKWKALPEIRARYEGRG